jgi:HEAT repeat protein
LALLLQEPETAQAAIVALEKLATPESLDLLMSVLDREGIDWLCRVSAAHAVGRHPLGRSQSARVLSPLEHPDPVIFATAASAAATLGLAEAIPSLMARLQDPNRTIFAGAYNAIIVMRPASELSALLALYRTGDYEERKKIGSLVACTFYPAAWLDVFELLHSSEVGEHRVWAARIAHEFAGGEQLPKLEAMISDRDGHVRKAAVRAIAAINSRGGHAGFGNRDPSALARPQLLGM